jgi:hypothetical protein
MHEVIHALEEWLDVAFSEEKVEELILKYQEKYKNEEFPCINED